MSSFQIVFSLVYGLISARNAGIFRGLLITQSSSLLAVLLAKWALKQGAV